ncbi:uncharacterized protein [Rutidosis leptorrhynchoides]|uniref:uncharacterized protein n=1 Tax=Rutidosis leptorrhynchoides TaxID=125765 RepID=UPI003A98D7A4
MKVLKSCLNKKDFIWTEEAEAAFHDIKRLLNELPTLTAPIAGETLILYLAASAEAISPVLIAEQKGIQMPIYFVNQPIKHILRNPESSGRLAKWAIELGDYEINFSPRHAVKEYEALLSGLRITSEMGIKHLRAYVDSQIVAQQVNGGFEAKDVSMKQYLQLVEKISKNFETLEVVQIPRNKNKKANVLSKLATLTFDHLHKKVLVEDGILPTDVTEARRIRVSAPLYVLENGVLYRKSFSGPNLRCLTPQQAIEWAIDIVGPFPRSVGNAKFLVVAIDFFSKWVEAKVLAWITGENIKKFVWNDIVCRYGLPNEIVSDNGKQFADNPFRSWCEELNIKQTFTSVAHPQANGQVEVTNKEIVDDMKARLGLSQTKWVDEVPHILWAHRTTPKWSTGETPFSLVYGTEAVIPAEICIPTQREGDLVLRDNEASRHEKQGNLGPRWEGPYKIIKANPNGSYTLTAPSGEEIPRTWNAMSLKKFYA